MQKNPYSSDALPWSIDFQMKCAANPLALVSQMAETGHLVGAVATFAWYDPLNVTAWAVQESNAVIADTLSTTRLAQQANVDTLNVMRKSLGNLLNNTCLSLDALAFVLDIVQASTKKSAQLRSLEKTLSFICDSRGVHVANPLNVCVLLDKTDNAVLNQDNGLIYSDPNAYADQLVDALSNAGDALPEHAPEGFSPFEQLMAVFTHTWNKPS